MPTWAYYGLQDGASPMMEQLIFFHDHAMIVIIMIVTFVGFMMGSLFFNSYINRYLLENQNIEIVWTVLPALILIFIALPSLRLLYLMDEVNSPLVTLKVVGHQWYWSYEFSDYFGHTEFDSYMICTDDLGMNGFRLLDVDNRVPLPMGIQIRVLVTSDDVIHSWAVPALGVKVDAIPGRLNQASFVINRPGLYYGQCSEICGANHSFMPIVIESVGAMEFLNWMFFESDRIMW